MPSQEYKGPAMQKDQEERRRYPRSRTGFKGIEDKSDPSVLNHVDNISCNGVLCHTVKPIPVMTKMSLMLELPKSGGVRIEAEGVVVRCDHHDQGDDHFRVAILYTKLTDEDHRLIREHVDHDLREAGPE